MNSATPARATRHSTSKNGPNAGTATRMNRNEPPHSAPSKMRPAKSLGFIRRYFRIRRASLRSVSLPSSDGVAQPAHRRNWGRCEPSPGSPVPRRSEYPMLVLEQALLEVQSTVEPAERAVRGDNSVAGYDHGQDVGGVGPAYGPGRAWPSEVVRDLPVRPGLSKWDARQLHPHGLLPLRADERERHIEGLAPPAYILGQLFSHAGGPGLVRLHGVAFVLQILFKDRPVVALYEVQPHEGSIFVHRECERACGRVYLVDVSFHAIASPFSA